MLSLENGLRLVTVALLVFPLAILECRLIGCYVTNLVFHHLAWELFLVAFNNAGIEEAEDIDEIEAGEEAVNLNYDTEEYIGYVDDETFIDLHVQRRGRESDSVSTQETFLDEEDLTWNTALSHYERDLISFDSSILVEPSVDTPEDVEYGKEMWNRRMNGRRSIHWNMNHRWCFERPPDVIRRDSI